jgi:hypothetical protein
MSAMNAHSPTNMFLDHQRRDGCIEQNLAA